MDEAVDRGVNFNLKIFSVVGWLGIIFAAAIVDGGLDDLGHLSRVVFFYGYWLSYQLIFALAVGNAFDMETDRSVRIKMAILWFYSFALMLATMIFVFFDDLYLEKMMPVMAVLTPLSCLSAGIYLIVRGHTFSGAITGALFLVSWAPPFGIYIFHFGW